MERKCEQCGEVLFGAVNRCWKCGTDVKVVVASTLPPVRRSPVKLRSRNQGFPQGKEATGLEQTAAGLSDVIANAKQVLPWFLNADISQVARERCGAVSIGLGILGCLIGLASGWSIVFGIAGVIFGLAGMPAKNRDLATMGLVVSVIAMFLGFAQIAFDIWIHYAGQRMVEDLQNGQFTEY